MKDFKQLSLIQKTISIFLLLVIIITFISSYYYINSQPIKVKCNNQEYIFENDKYIDIRIQEVCFGKKLNLPYIINNTK